MSSKLQQGDNDDDDEAAIGCLLPRLGVAPSGKRLRRKGMHGVICR